MINIMIFDTVYDVYYKKSIKVRKRKKIKENSRYKKSGENCISSYTGTQMHIYAAGRSYLCTKATALRSSFL